MVSDRAINSSSHKATTALVIASVLPLLGVLSSIAMVTGGVEDLVAGIVAFFASVFMFCFILPAVFMARRACSRAVKIGVFLVAIAELVASALVLYGIKCEWWVS